MTLAGKRVLVTGVLTRESIAWATAARAQELGAEVVLTSFGRARRMAERAARRLPVVPDVLELDVHDPAHHAALAEDLGARWGHLDGVLHAIAHGSPAACAGGFLDTPEADALDAFRTSAWSLNALARTTAPLLARAPGGGSLVALDFEGAPAWGGYNWMAVAKSGLREISRYLAAELGPHGVRCNLVAAGPLMTVSGSALPLMDLAAPSWGEQAPLGWDPHDAGVVADAVCLLLSDLARGITGEVLHVDGGLHAVGGHCPDAWRRGAADLDALRPDAAPAPAP